MEKYEESKLYKIRHSTAHLLAYAVKQLYPNVKIAIGPVIDDGFYYDFDFEKDNISEEVLTKIEEKMRELQKNGFGFEQRWINADEAKQLFKDEPYKLEIIEEISKGERDDFGKSGEVSIYKSGEFEDLCKGPHCENISEIGAFKLLNIAGAYWKGDEKNKMLTRIYGTAFEKEEDLNNYLNLLEEAKKRDHRKLGKELGLFVFSDVVGKGLPLWTEKGATIRRELERFIVDEERRRGYKHVVTPDIAKVELYKKSGHYPYYKDSMYAPILDEDEEFMLRPMTCPHHFELYLSEPRSYKELPMRIAEIAKLYRYEKSGELTGLLRVRSFCLADAHIICADVEQAKQEINGALDLIEYVANIFGLKMGENYWYRLSLGDKKDEKKYYKDDEAWDKGENTLRELLNERKAQYYEAEGEAAFYGPKIDIQMKNILGKEDTAFTVQYDFVMPKRFNLKYIDKDGLEKEALVVHRSSVGAIERIVGFLIEHFAGAFPVWLSPVQVEIIPINDKVLDYAKSIKEELEANNIRVEIDSREETMQNKIRKAQEQKIPYMFIIGDREKENKKISVRTRDNQQHNSIDLEEFEKTINGIIENKSIKIWN